MKGGRDISPFILFHSQISFITFGSEHVPSPSLTDTTLIPSNWALKPPQLPKPSCFPFMFSFSFSWSSNPLFTHLLNAHYLNHRQSCGLYILHRPQVLQCLKLKFIRLKLTTLLTPPISAWKCGILKVTSAIHVTAKWPFFSHPSS